ncbi:MAG: HNH endonuclease [Bacteroidetes bacterium]|nr:HNH endonuclease [Bacteroidota bacterium]
MDFDDINKELKNVQMKAKDIREIKGVLNEKFHLYFDDREAKVLAKITTPTLTVILKKVNTLQFGRSGELTIDTFFLLQKEIEPNLAKVTETEGSTVLALLQKLLVIAAIKVDEAEDMSYKEKFDIFDVLIRNVEKILLVHSIPFSEFLPNGSKVFKAFRKKYETIDVSVVKKKPRKAISNKMRARLQKEINSKCPFCEDEEVEHFDGHHIDEDPSNTVLENLLLLCKKCHSKIGEGTITKEEVQLRKASLRQVSTHGIEVYKIDIISDNSCWEPYPNVKNAFRLNWERGNDFPIFQFHLVNNLNKTVVLSDIKLRAKHLFSGIGDLPQPCEVPKSTVYNLFIESGREIHTINNFNGIQIPAKQAVTIQVEVAQKNDNYYENLEKRMVLNFTLKFSSNIQFDLPKILINTDNEKQGINLVCLD